MELQGRWLNAVNMVGVDAGKMVVLASGGPLMEVECVEGEIAICRWTDWEDRGGGLYGECHRHAFPVRCLRKLSPVTKEEIQSMVS